MSEQATVEKKPDAYTAIQNAADQMRECEAAKTRLEETARVLKRRGDLYVTTGGFFGLTLVPEESDMADIRKMMRKMIGRKIMEVTTKYEIAKQDLIDASMTIAGEGGAWTPKAGA